MAALSHDERMAALTLAEVYPHYVTKAEKKAIPSVHCLR